MQRKNKENEVPVKDASKLKIGIVVSAYYADQITGGLLAGAMDTLRTWKVAEKNITIVRTPGCFEIPFGCLALLNGKKKPDAIITLGCIVKGETDHDKYIASAVTQGIIDLTREYQTPISLGILTVNNLAQAKARSTGKNNKGCEAAVAAMEMALL